MQPRVNASHPDRPCRIILIRHGESEANVDKELNRRVPDHRINITEEGEKAIVRIIFWLHDK